MMKHRAVAVSAIVLTVLIIGSVLGLLAVSLTQSQNISSPPVSHSPIHINAGSVQVTASLGITVKDASGKVIASRYYPQDPFTNNMYNILIGSLVSSNTPTALGCNVGTIYATSGSTYTFCHAYSSISWWWYGNNQAWILMGNGTGSASATDYKLFNQVASIQAGASQIVTNANWGNFTFSATWSPSINQNVTEVGAMSVLQNNGGGTSDVLLTHDTFSYVTVPSGGSITAQYTISSKTDNGQMTYNFIQILFQMFDTRDGYGSCGANYLLYYDTASTSYICNSGAEYERTYIGVGTSTTASASGQVNLQSPVGVNNAVGTFNVNLTTHTITFSASVVPSTTASTVVTEAAFFMAFGAGGYSIALNNQISTAGNAAVEMFWRTTFTGVTVPANTAITVTFTFKVS